MSAYHYADMTGLSEAVTQLRGEAGDRQLPKRRLEHGDRARRRGRVPGHELHAFDPDTQEVVPIASERPQPNIDEDNQDFWEAVRRREFKLYRCTACGAWYWPFAFCRNHSNEPFAANIQLAEASGRGTVFSFNIHNVAFDPAFRDDAPYVYALIELEEGPMFATNVIECPPEDVAIGMPVEIIFQDVEEGVTLPKVRPTR